MKASEYTNRLRNGVALCPVRNICPLAFMCGMQLDGDRYALPSISNVGYHEMLWTDLDGRRRVYAIRTGLFLIKGFANNGSEIPLSLSPAGMTGGIPDMYTSYVASSFYFFSALIPAEVCIFDGELVKEQINALGASKALDKLSLLALNQNTATYSQTLTLQHQRARERVVSVLLRLENVLMRQGDFDGTLPLSHDDIAFIAGIERATTSKELKDLANQNLITLKYRRIQLLPALRQSYGYMIEATLPFYREDKDTNA